MRVLWRASLSNDVRCSDHARKRWFRMKLKSIPVVIGCLIAFCLSHGAVSISQSDRQERKQPYFRIGNEGVITGTVYFSGAPPKARRIDMSADPICWDVNPRPLSQDLLVRRGRLKNAFVYIRSGYPLDALTFETPAKAPVIDQRGCVFVPRVLGVQVNQTIEVRNSDPTIHNVHEVPKKNPDRNQSQRPGAGPIMIRFAQPEIMVPIKCNQHPWMRTYVGVLPHPFFSVTDRNGAFKIEGLPPGTYTIVVWHERLGEQAREVTLYSNRKEQMEFRFNSKDYPDLYRWRW